VDKIVFGLKPILSLLDSNIKIEEIIINENIEKNKKEAILKKLKKGIKISYTDKKNIDKICGSEKNQGIVAKIKTDITYRKLEEFKDSNLILILDHIQDPQNLGAIIRTANKFNVDAVIIPENRAIGITSTVIKASTGAVFFTPIIRVNSLLSTIKLLKEWNFWIYSADMNGKDIREINFDGKKAVVMGSEEGISQKILENSDFIIKIPTGGSIDSLNVSVATGIILYSIYIQS